MKLEIIPLLILASSFLTLFAFAEFLYRKQKVKAEWTRKIVHIGTGLLTLLFPVLLQNHWQVLLLCASFLVLLLASLKLKFLPSINGINRHSYGSILFPIVVYSCYLLYSFTNKGLIIYYLPILILAICDPVAAFAGKRNPFGAYFIGKSKKTFSGSIAFFAASLLITSLLFYLMKVPFTAGTQMLAWTIGISIIATISEAIGVKGFDNFTIPASVAVTLYLIL